jgi:hypothetical protein
MFTVKSRLAMCIAYTIALCFMVIQTYETGGPLYIIGVIISVACITSLFFIGEDDENRTH